ncbi:hypothetical protein F5Y18DRAFT_151471 [Xylariaceae sp. FL1019]|nr:hypothetical protein F5Y18DRAFT_151471 [Xylariaceae sp. FL1019]
MAAQDPTAPKDSNGAGLYVAATVTLSIAWLSVSLRTYVRAIMTKSFQADDWVMLAGLANFTASCAFILAGLHFGLGHHNQALSQYNEIKALKFQALATASYVSNMWLIKLSIGLFLYRLAVQKRYKYTLGISIVVVGIWSLALFFWNIFQCHPVDAQWDYTILQKDPNAACVSADEVVSAAYALSALTILSDWLYALLPIPMIWAVKMTPQAKMTVIAILGLGVFASIATLIRLKFLSDLTDTADILFAGTDAMIWTLVEPGIAISAASLATIRPLLRRLRIKGFTSSAHSLSHGNTSRTPRRVSRMPAFGSQDLTLVDIEHGSPTTRKSPLTLNTPLSNFSLPISRGVEEDTRDYFHARVGLSPFPQTGMRRGESKSETETYVSERTRSPPAPGMPGVQEAWLNSESESSLENIRPIPRAAQRRA